MFKRNVFKILAIVFFLLAGASFYNSNKSTPKIVIQNKKTVNKIVSPTLPAVTLINTEPTIIPTQTIILPTNTPVPPSPTKASATEAQLQSLKVSLSIGGSSVGTIDVPNDANQCDVLTQALSQGKIQSLNMRYNNDYGTNAVYQINSVGKENVVWWGFKVNGLSPSQGCSYIKVNNEDNILWEYVGN